MNKLDIVILNYNTADLLRNCLQSVIQSIREAESNQDKIKILVVDNASSDGSVEMVEAEFPEAKLVKSNKNLGFAKGNNLAAPFLDSEYVLFLNPDTVIRKDTLKIMLDFMDGHTDVGAATCKVVLTDGKLYYACHRGFPSPWNALCFFTGLSKIFPKTKPFNGYTLSYLPLDTTHEIDSCSGTFLMIRKEIGNKLSWWDEDYFWYGEDLDFCYRIKQAGWKVMYVPKTQITHIWGAASGLKKESSTVSTADRVTKIRATNARFDVMKIFYKKHYQKRYPKYLTTLVLLAVDLKKALALKNIK